jgi:hypothetical protein
VIDNIQHLEAYLPRLLAADDRLRRCLPSSSRVTIRHADGRKVRRDTQIENWNPIGCKIEIELGVSAEERAETKEPAAPMPPVQRPGSPMHDLLRTLDAAEREPGHDFVSLKWFRDSVLPTRGFEWASDPETRHALLSEAIEKQLILTRKIPNPRQPAFPTTTIRVNRLQTAVREALGQARAGTPFIPKIIQGEPLSETVLRNRR